MDIKKNNDSNKNSFLEFKGVKVFYDGQKALDDINLTIPIGARVALLGPNGAGKSTLMKLVCGAMDPDEGTISAFGLSPEQNRTDPTSVGWLPEGAPLNPELTVYEHLRLTARLRGLSPNLEKSEIDRLVLALNLGDKVKRLARSLSMGSRRLVALALALLGRPKLVVLDEPSSSLDPDGVRRLKALLKDLEAGATLLISSHILSEVAELTDLAIILAFGRIAACGPWDKISGPEDFYFKAIESHIESQKRSLFEGQ
ncbi:MAG: ABC transporter ATP-binding protein, partial [Deltaproteobacteria bacterium]|nr:ABC transporter ATP-binding protein [Deltaproteobacteria bacterium]